MAIRDNIPQSNGTNFYSLTRVGNGAKNYTISDLPFTPDLIMINGPRASGYSATWEGRDFVNTAMTFGATTNIVLSDRGFTETTYHNVSGQNYTIFCYKYA